jgi:pilus assembly protein Flp/PilA
LEGNPQAAPRMNRSTARKNPTVAFIPGYSASARRGCWNGGILMKSLALKLHRFLKSEDGPTAVEYAVMLSLIVIVCLSAISTIGVNANSVFWKIASSVH